MNTRNEKTAKNENLNLSWKVIKRDGITEVPFERNKIFNAIKKAFKSVNDTDENCNDVAIAITNKTIDLLKEDLNNNKSDRVVFSVEEIQDKVEHSLIQFGYSKIAKEYIVYREKRNQVRMMNSSLMRTYKDFILKDVSEVDELRENANIDAITPMGGILKFGTEASKMFSKLFLISNKFVKLHNEGYAHQHDLDFYSQKTINCLSPCTNLIVRDELGNVKNITASYLDRFFTVDDKREIVDFNSYNWNIYSKDKFVKIKSIMRTPIQNEQVYKLRTESGKLELTGKHVVPVHKNCLQNAEQTDVEVKDIQIGDCLVPATVCSSVFSNHEINLIDKFGACKDIFICESDLVLEKVHKQKDAKIYKQVSLYDYHLWRGHIDIDEKELHLIHRDGLKDRIIPAVLPLTKELGKIMGYMFSEGSFQHKTESESSVFYSHAVKIVDDFIYCMNTVFPEIQVQITYMPRSSKWSGCYFSDILFESLFKGPLGYKYNSDDVHLPDWIFTSNKEFLSGFFGGLIDSNGTVNLIDSTGAINKYGNSSSVIFEYSSAYHSFVEELMYLLRLLGIDTTRYTSNHKGEVDKFDNFRIVGKSINDCLWFDSAIMRDVYIAIGNSEDGIRNDIINIEQYEYSGFVYDIETENHYFNANGYVVHNCIQQDIKSVLERGFYSGHGFLRTPGEIRSAAALVCISIQSSQCDMHGGQSVANFDYGLAPYVAKTYIKKIVDLLEIDFTEDAINFVKTYLKTYYDEHSDVLSETAKKEFTKQFGMYCVQNYNQHFDVVTDKISRCIEKAIERTDKETYQAMEALIHNFNTMKSRSGGQVPFSSINFGTDITKEGRMVSRNFLKAIDAGLGKHETSIFPVAIFKVKRGFNYNKEDPNYDLFKLSCEVSSKRLFPNFLFLDASFNKQYYKEGHPETEVAVMGAAHYDEIVKIRLNCTEIISGKIGDIVNCLFERKDCIDGSIIQFDENTQYCNLKNVEIQSIKENNFTRVKKCMRWEQVNLDWREVVFDDNSRVIVTHDHPLSSDKGRKIADDLECGDKILEIKKENTLYLTDPYKTIVAINKIVPNKSNFAYDFETESDIFGLSGIVSHNCRTRVMGNVYDPENETTYGRGNISFTTINLPMLALDAKQEDPDHVIDCFFKKLKDLELTVFDQLVERMEFQMTARVENFPTVMGQHLWMGSENLSNKDTIESVIKHGTLSVGFVGLAETLVVLIGKHHGESEEAQELGLKIVKFMRDLCDEKSQEMKLNFSLIGTPAESTVGNFLRIIRKKYGVIPNVTDHEYITNSSHIPVYYNTSIKHKIDVEAPYHKYCNAGCILYVEMNGDPSKNVDAFMDIVKYAESKEVNYFSINHVVDRCPVCSYIGVIDDTCPRCGFSEETGVDLEKLKELQKYYPNITIPEI